MSGQKSYVDAMNIGDIMRGGTIGVVEETNNNDFKKGDVVNAMGGWQQFCISNGKGVRKIPLDTGFPLDSFMSIFGMTGMTAYFGLLDITKPQEGETLVVSAAAGAVGSIVSQIGKIKGCRVIGIAGSQEKCDWLVNDLGIDGSINYKTDNLRGKLKELCPKGIDIYFENVGGEITKDVSKFLNKGARVPICGFISKYNSPDIASEETPFHVLGALKPKPKHRFFVVTEWLNQFEKTTAILLEHIKSGDLKYKETITQGFENAPQALRDVLSGKNFGKQIIKI